MLNSRAPRRSHHPAGYIMAAALIAAVVGFLVPTCLAGCLTPEQMAADGPYIRAGLAAACEGATFIPIPIVEGIVAGACQGAENDVAAAVTQAQNEIAAQQAPAPTTAAKAKAKPAAAEPNVPLFKLGKGGKPKVAGHCPAHLAPLAQFYLLTAHASPADAGTDASLPMAPAVLPVTVVVVDAGKDGAP